MIIHKQEKRKANFIFISFENWSVGAVVAFGTKNVTKIIYIHSFKPIKIESCQIYEALSKIYTLFFSDVH